MELVVTLAIICIMACAALPGWGILTSRNDLSCQADQLNAFLHQQRERAIRDGIRSRVLFKPEEKTWLSFSDTNGNGRHDQGEQQCGPYSLTRGISFGSLAKAGPNNTIIPSDGISLTDNRVSFSPMGGCNAGTIYMKSRDRSIALRILPASGAVIVYSYSLCWEVLR